MYRAVAWKARYEGVELSDGAAVAAVANRAVINLGTGITIDGHDVTSAIRTAEMDQAAAIVARHPAGRAVLVARQRAFGDEGAVVMEGRDIGTVVFPAADVKVYLDASADERARRRALDPAHSAGKQKEAVAQVAEALLARDQSDRTRAASPLTKADDATYIDTTGVGIDDVVRAVMELIAKGERANE